MQSYAPCGRACFCPHTPIHPLFLSVRVFAGLEKEVTPEGKPEVRKERIPPIRPCHEFDSLGLSARADVSGVGSVCLGHEACLHPVERWVEHAVLDTKARKRAGEYLGDQRLQSLLERNLCGPAGDERQSA